MSPEWVAVGLTVLVQAVGYGKLVQMVKQHDTTLTDHENRLREKEGLPKVLHHAAGR